MNFEDFLKVAEAEKEITKLPKRVRKRPMRRKGWKPPPVRDKSDGHSRKGTDQEYISINTVLKEEDFLKYYGIAEIWVCNKYSITRDEFHTLLILYSEDVFDKKIFDVFSKGMTTKPKTIFRYVKNGLIEKINTDRYVYLYNREKTSKITAIYKLTHLSKTMIKAFYDKILNRSSIPESLQGVRFLRTTKYTPNYTRMVREMNNKLLAKEKGD